MNGTLAQRIADEHGFTVQQVKDLWVAVVAQTDGNGNDTRDLTPDEDTVAFEVRAAATEEDGEMVDAQD